MIFTVLILLVTALMGVGMVYFVYSVINVLSVVIVILVFPLLVKFIGDYLLYHLVDLDKKVAFVVSVMLSIPIVVVLYMNMWGLIIGAIIIGIVYVAGWSLVEKNMKAAFSIKKWFEEKK